MKLPYCFTCNKTTDLTQHHIIPQCYLSKVGDKYDFQITLCAKCHHQYEVGAQKIKSNHPPTAKIIEQNAEITKVIRAGRALLRIKQGSIQVPQERTLELENTVVSYFGKLDLQKAIELQLITFDEIEIEDIKGFVEMWVADFLKYCKQRKRRKVNINGLLEEWRSIHD